jgi:hypothetical protein
MSAATSPEPVTAPRGWLRLALFGAFVYLASKLMEFYPTAASQATGISPTNLGSYLPVLAGAGLVLFLCGLVAAFWRLNRAVGHTHAGVVGLVAGAVGVFVLAGLVVLDLAMALGLPIPLLAALGSRQALTDLVGTFFAFVGLATLGVGLVHARGLFQPAPAPREAVQETSDVRYY